MKKFRKLMSGILATAAFATSINVSFASNIIENVSPQDEVYCTYLSEDSQLVDLTVQEVEAGNWNPERLDGAVPLVYEDFPARVESEFNNFAELSVKITYLKTLENADTAYLMVTDVENGEVFIDDAFNNIDATKTIFNIPIGRTYSLEIFEEIDGVETQYNAVITTQYELAKMPGNVSVYGRSYFGEDAVEKVKISEKRKDIILDENGEEIPKESQVVLVSNLPEVYQNLSEDKLYMVETSRLVDGNYERYKGFINKSNDLSVPEIFMPTHCFYDTVADAVEQSAELKTVSEYTLMNTPSVLSEEPQETSYTKNELEDMNPTTIEHLRDRHFSMATNDYRFFKYQVGDTNNYRFRAISNYPTYIDRWAYYGDEGNQTPNTALTCTHTESNSTTTVTVAYVVDTIIYLKAGNSRSGKLIFTAERVQNDDFGNSIYDLQQSGTQTASNTEIDGCIEYKGDSDVFYINPGSAPTGKFGVKVTNNHTSSAMRVMVSYQESEDDDYLYDAYDEQTFIGANSTGAVMFDYVPGYQYFVIVILEDHERYNADYTIEFVTPDKHDAYETAGGNANNNDETKAIVLTGTSGTLTGLTIHKGDDDWFKINSGETGADMTVRITKAGAGYDAYSQVTIYEDRDNDGEDEEYKEQDYTANCIKIYQPRLYSIIDLELAEFDEGSWIGDYNTYTITDVAPNTDVYFEAISLGKNYSAAHEYSLEYTVTYNQVSTATLNTNVSLSKTTTDETTVDTLKEQIAQNTTFTLNSATVPAATALADTDLYYISGTDEILLTDTELNSLTAGSYNLIFKYNGILATGGTITLTVSEPAETTVVEVAIPSLGALSTASWDWARCAKIIANVKRVGDGLEESTVTDRTIAIEIYRLLYPDLSNIQLAAKREKLDLFTITYAAEYVYDGTISDEVLPEKFIETDNLAYYNENTFYNMIASGKVAILYLQSISNPTSYDAGKYVVICGVDKTDHEYKIYDPVMNTSDWYSSASFYSGGAMGNSDLIFTGAVVESE